MPPTLNLKKTARQQAHAEALPQLQSTRRGTRAQVRGLRSEEDPLTAGIEAQIAALKGAGLRRPEYERAMEEAATRLGQIPAGISSQILSTREAGQEAEGDIKTQEAANFHSIFSGLQTAAATHQQEVADEQRSDARHTAEGLAAQVQEKAAGLGDYAPDTLNPLEEASIPKVEAETRALEHPNSAANLTPSERRGLSEDHTAAAAYAKQLFQEAKSGLYEDAGISNDPKQWDQNIWDGLVTHVSEKGKVPVTAAQTAVSAIQDHVHGPSATGALKAVAGAAAGIALPPALSKLAGAALGY